MIYFKDKYLTLTLLKEKFQSKYFAYLLNSRQVPLFTSSKIDENKE